MRTLSAPVLAALAAGTVQLAQLLRLQFASGDVLLNTSNYDLPWDALTYKGAFGLGTVSPVVDRAGEVQGMTLQLISGESSTVSLALDDADQVQGTLLTLRTAIVAVDTFAVLDAPIDWVGRCDTMALSEDGTQVVVTVSAESGGVDLLRGNLATYSHADQLAAYPGDLAFAYVISQADKPIVWPSRGYFLR